MGRFRCLDIFAALKLNQKINFQSNLIIFYFCIMNTVIIGSGNVAYHLAKAFKERSLPVSLFGRNAGELERISDELDLPFYTELPKADLFLICVSDRAVEEVSLQIPYQDALVAHTSGSLPREALKGSYRKACFYPLQTFSRKQKLNYSEIPIFVDAETPEDANVLKHLASEISGSVMEISFEQRKYLHLTAVFACNFVNHLFARAKEIADAQEIPFRYFLPLIDETVKKIHHANPEDVQTGPAVRNDKTILERHEKLITNTETAKIYDVMNESIRTMYHLE